MPCRGAFFGVARHVREFCTHLHTDGRPGIGTEASREQIHDRVNFCHGQPCASPADGKVHTALEKLAKEHPLIMAVQPYAPTGLRACTVQRMFRDIGENFSLGTGRYHAL